MLVLEILCIAVANYYTSAPELVKPTHLQLNQIKNLLSFVHQNFLNVADLILSKLPVEAMNNVWATTLTNLIKNKKGKRSKKSDPYSMQIRQHNDNLVNILKNLVRQGLAQNP